MCQGRQHKFKAFFLLIVVAAALLTGCLGGSGKESEAEVKQELNKLIDGFASAVAGQDLDAVLEYVAADITFVTYFGEEVLNEIFASIIEAEVIPTLEDPEDEMWGYQDILPEFLEMMEELKDLYDAKGAEDPEVQELMYDVVRYWSKLGLISELAWVYLTELEENEEPTAFWETLLGWVNAAEWTNDSLIVPADVFEHFVAGILEDLSVAADELGPFSEAGKWYAEISLRSNVPEDEEEYEIPALIGFKKTGSGWIIDLFQLNWVLGA